MSKIAMPPCSLDSSCNSLSKSKICKRKLTSSAVVGSSAINSRGLQAKAIAIMARWRCPPDS